MQQPPRILEELIRYVEMNYVSLGLIFSFVVGGWIAANFIKRRVRLRLVAKSPNHVTATFISQLIAFILKSGIVVATLYMLGLDSFTNKILAGAGLLTFVVGFALKDIAENFLAGIILAFKSPFRMNDLIDINGTVGFVKGISIRETMLKTPDGKDVFMPNAIILKSPLLNYTIDGFLRYEFTIGIAYENNPTEAIQLIHDTVNNMPEVLKEDRRPIIMIDEFTTNTINLKVWFWVDTFKTTRRSVHQVIRSEVMDKVVTALLTHGFSLPASVVELKNYSESNPLLVRNQ
jgi:small conductance mechanosensitive channel